MIAAATCYFNGMPYASISNKPDLYNEFEAMNNDAKALYPDLACSGKAAEFPIAGQQVQIPSENCKMENSLRGWEAPSNSILPCRRKRRNGTESELSVSEYEDRSRKRVRSEAGLFFHITIINAQIEPDHLLFLEIAITFRSLPLLRRCAAILKQPTR